MERAVVAGSGDEVGKKEGRRGGRARQLVYECVAGVACAVRPDASRAAAASEATRQDSSVVLDELRVDVCEG